MNKGKVPRHEWPAIVRRHAAGESFAVISRDYGCSAPAIRYIVNRFEQLPGGQTAVEGPAADVATRPTPEQRSEFEDEALSFGRVPGKHATADLSALEGASEALEAAQRATSDIASFLGALDAALIERSEEKLDLLLVATDRLMFLAARMRVGIEALARRLAKT
jgi:hypothetical protein